MAYSFTENLGNGTTTAFMFSFVGEGIGYLRESDIVVSLDGVTTTAFTFSGTNQIEFTGAPASGVEILIRRIMPKLAPYADFSRGNNFGEKQLNYTALQHLYSLHEVLDGFKDIEEYMKQDLRMGDNKIIELAAGVDDTDATNVLQVQSYNDAQDSRLNDLESTLTVGSLTYRRTTFTAVGGQTEFYPLNATFSAIHSLFINGVHQIAGEAYELIGSTGFRTIALTEGDRVVAVIGEEPQFVTPIQVDLRYTRYSFFATGGEASKVSPISFEQVISVYINGVHQTFGTAFDFVASTNTVNFASSLEGGDDVVLVIGADPSELVGMPEATADAKYGLLIIPTSPTGLPTGSLWNDGGILTLV